MTALVIQSAVMVSGILVARMLGPENRGHLAFIVLAPLILSQIGNLGLPLALTFYVSRSPGMHAVLVWKAARILLPSICLCLLVHVAIILAFASRDGTDVLVAALLTTLATAAWIVQAVALAVLQGQQRFGAFNSLRSLQVVLYALMSALILVSGSHDLTAVAGTWSLTYVLSAAAALAVAHSRASAIPSGPDAVSIGDMARFGLRSLPGHVSPVESFRLDQLFLGVVAGPAALGLYVVGASLTNLPRMVAHSIGVVAYPKVAAAQSGRATIALRYTVAAVAACGLTVGMLEVLSSFLIPWFFGAQFGAAVNIARILLIAAFFMSVKRILNDCARGLGLPEMGLRGEVISWLPLLPGFLLAGTAEGVAWTLVASSALGTGAVAAQLSLHCSRRPEPKSAGSALHVA
jgi:O-antigen/teichoic acid export membrane protein